MCEICLLKAEINKTNAEAILALANAASALSLNVGGSEAAIQAINARILESVKLPEPDKASEPQPVNGEAGTASDDKAEDAFELPEELKYLRDLLGKMGIETEVTRFPKR